MPERTLARLAGGGGRPYPWAMATYRLNEPQAQWLAQQVAAGAADSEDAYLARLVEADRAYAEKLAVLHAALDEGEASGISERSLDEIWAEAMRQHDAARAV